MRTITKNVNLLIDGKPYTFRLKKLDAFSGASLLRLLARNAPEEDGEDFFTAVFSSLSEEELRGLMSVCLSHAEVKLDAGYQPVMQEGEWSWSELEYDAVNSLHLVLKVILWTLEGFFPESGSSSEPDRPAT